MTDALRAAPQSRLRAVVVCPGRGAYGKDQLGTLTPAPGGRAAAMSGPEGKRLLALADAVRSKAGRPTIGELDAEDRFQPRIHLASDNASSLIYTLSSLDALRLSEFEVVAAVGNSLGWYTALHIAGALDFEAGLRIVEATGAFQAEQPIGGQVIYPLTDETWQLRPELAETVDSALTRANDKGYAAPSVRLGGALVIGGDDTGLAGLRAALPRTRRSRTSYPLRLAGHSAFHTPLMAGMAKQVGAELQDLAFQAPRLSLVDGAGRVWRPLIADPAALMAYTLGAQMTTPYDFALSVRVALREFAPDALVLLGPGAGLGGTLGQILAIEGWSGVRTKDDFKIRQESPRPMVL